MKVGPSHITPSNPCPSCGKALDRCSELGGDRQPRPGDITICITCGHIMAFADDLTFRELTDDEMRAVAGDPRVIRIQQARKAIQREPAA